MKTKFLLSTLLFLHILTLNAFAGPGGIIIKAIERSFWIKILLLFLFILFLPLILYSEAKKRLKIIKTYKNLKIMGKKNDLFNWFNVKNRVKDSFLRVHTAWRKEDIKEASQWMTNWYWQNQQLVFLDEWEQKGLINICNVEKINFIRPLHFEYKEGNEDSRIVVSIGSNREDYLRKRNTKEIVLGEIGYKDVETIWTFILKDNKWLVENIEEPDSIYEYINMENILPESNLAKNQV